MNLDPLSLGIGLGLGLLVAVFVLKARRSTPDVEVRQLKTRITSLNLQLDRTRRDLSESKAVVARLLTGQQSGVEGEAVGLQSNDLLPGDLLAADSSAGDLLVVVPDGEPPNLTHVTGIGPKLAITLASYGITDLERLASITDREVAAIELNAPALAERMSREKWQEQAIRMLEIPQPQSGPESGVKPSPMDPYIDQFDWSRLRQAGSINGSTGSS